MASNDSAAGANNRSGGVRRIISVVAIQGIVFLALLEIIARVLDPVGISYYNETARLFDSMIIEEPIGYRFPPGLQDNFNGVSVNINDLGMRDDPIPAAKEPGETRVLAIGDSVIFSVGVSAENSIPKQLQRKLNAAAAEGDSYRVMNLGVPSYNTVQELEFLKRAGLGLQADVAFLFLIPNDIQDKMWVYERRSSPIADFAQRSYALGLLFYTGRWLINLAGVSTNPNKVRSSDLEGVEPDGLTGQALTEEQLFAAKALASPAWMNIETSLLEIHSLLKARDIPLLLLYRNQLQDAFAQRLEELAQEQGFAIRRFNLWDDPRWSALDKSQYVNSPIDGHCNPAGCNLYAQYIFESLQQAGLLPRITE